MSSIEGQDNIIRVNNQRKSKEHFPELKKHSGMEIENSLTGRIRIRPVLHWRPHRELRRTWIRSI